MPLPSASPRLPVSAILPCQRRPVGTLRLVNPAAAPTDVPPKTPRRPILKPSSTVNKNVDHTRAGSIQLSEYPTNSAIDTSKKVVFINSPYVVSATTIDTAETDSYKSRVSSITDTKTVVVSLTEHPELDIENVVWPVKTNTAKKSEYLFDPVVMDKTVLETLGSATPEESYKSTTYNSSIDHTSVLPYPTNSALASDIETYQSLIRELQDNVKYLKQHSRALHKQRRQHAFRLW